MPVKKKLPVLKPLEPIATCWVCKGDLYEGMRPANCWVYEEKVRTQRGMLSSTSDYPKIPLHCPLNREQWWTKI